MWTPEDKSKQPYLVGENKQLCLYIGVTTTICCWYYGSQSEKMALVERATHTYILHALHQQSWH